MQTQEQSIILWKNYTIWIRCAKTLQKIWKWYKMCAFNEKIKKKQTFLINLQSIWKIGINLIDPLNDTYKKWNFYIVVRIEYCKIIVELRHVKKKLPKILVILSTIKILNYSCPNVLLNDNRKEFNNKFIETFCKKLKISKNF